MAVLAVSLSAAISVETPAAEKAEGAHSAMAAAIGSAVERVAAERVAAERVAAAEEVVAERFFAAEEVAAERVVAYESTVQPVAALPDAEAVAPQRGCSVPSASVSIPKVSSFVHPTDSAASAGYSGSSRARR